MFPSSVIPNFGSAVSMLVAEQTLLAAATTVTFTGLDGDAHGGYEIILNLKNAVASTNTVFGYVNNDTTNANYYSQAYSLNGTVGTASRDNYPTIGNIATSLSGFIKTELIRDYDGYIRYFSRCSRAAAAGIIHELFSGAKTATTTNIIRLDFTGNTNGFGIGSKISIYRRK